MLCQVDYTKKQPKWIIIKNPLNRFCFYSKLWRVKLIQASIPTEINVKWYYQLLLPNIRNKSYKDKPTE
jgi:hypothetical protein